MRLFDLALRGLAWVLFKVFHDFRVEGAEHVPDSGAVIIASNHPSYLDPVYIHLGLQRPVRFLAWEKPFQVPVLGALIRRSGAIPVNTDRPGRASFESAVKVLRAGEAFGIFPEGGRSDFGVMNPFKSGMARLAMMTGAPIVPVTVRGAFRVWPKYQLLPQPGYVQVIFHPPIRPAPNPSGEGSARHRDQEKEIVEQVTAAINSSLLPSLRAEAREESLYYKARVPWNWSYDAAPYLFFGALGMLGRLTEARLPPRLIIWAGLYTIYLATDVMFNPPGAWVKGLRTRAPWLLLGVLAVDFADWSPPAVAAGALGYLVLSWYSSFRFTEFKRWKSLAVAAGYALLFVWIWISLV